MSDILKKAREKEKKTKDKRKEKPLSEPIQQETPPQPVKEKLIPKPYGAKKPGIEKQKEEKTKISEFKISPAIIKRTKIASDEETLKLYEETLVLMRELLKENINYESINSEEIVTQIKKIIDQLSLKNEKMLMLGFTKDSKRENYLLCHSINVCIYSVEIGLGLNYDKSRLMELGISALLHDIGMVKYSHLSNQPRKLSAKEYNEIKNHPREGMEILKKIRNLPSVAIHVTYQYHERIDGSGYPKGLKGKSINEYAKIVGLADTYEALLHPRPYRNGFISSEAIQEILANKDAFEYKLIKILFEKIGVFPMGSLVELNTKEIGQVIKLNHEIPLRPVIKITYEADGKESKETRILDLTAHPTISVKHTLSQKK